MIDWAVSESSWPVGSSAMSTRGSWGERPCDGDALLLAAGQLVRALAGVVGQPDGEQPRRTRSSRSRAGGA